MERSVKRVLNFDSGADTPVRSIPGTSQHTVHSTHKPSDIDSTAEKHLACLITPDIIAAVERGMTHRSFFAELVYELDEA